MALDDEGAVINGEAHPAHLPGSVLDVEAIVWQLYDAGFRPSIKYGAGKLSWVSLTVNNRTFIIKSQHMIDWAIDGMMEVEDSGVFNRLQDAKTEFHYQLFK
ncbi:MAG: hypothetical protein ACKPKO_25090, partial [Candidatus Fonsibacter sp.]